METYEKEFVLLGGVKTKSSNGWSHCCCHLYVST